MSGGFVWRDAGRTVELREGLAGRAPEALAEHGFAQFELVGTPRALAEEPRLLAAAAAVHELGPGPVPEASAALLGKVAGPRLVALGGGRAIDSAKAVAAVAGFEVAAIPTTMSGAEMTGFHRLPAGAGAAATVRPSVVLADPRKMASQPEPQLRASSMNALAHGADSLCTPLANPVSRMLAVRGAGLIARALDTPRSRRDEAALAEGSLLGGYAIDSALFGVHHVVCQTLARRRGLPHAEVNAALLPVTLALLAARAPERLAPYLDAIGAGEGVEERVRALGGEPAGLGALGLGGDGIDDVLDEALARPQLANSPGPLGREELAELIERAR